MNSPCLFIHRLGVDLEPPAPNTMRQILAVTAADHGFPTNALSRPFGGPKLVRAKQDFMWRCRQVKNPDGKARFSYPRIAAFIGRKDHTTVLIAVRKWQSAIDEAQQVAA